MVMSLKDFELNIYKERIQYIPEDNNLLSEIYCRNAEQAISYGWTEVEKYITEWKNTLQS
jgi:hypothetical protein